ncbi:SWIM zinc finger family protein [uncultured Clostridium sp.]|uniref:SWIM zinc finger family protein n=1 Tax=uncultured Clostridium sp. TaxID=59620 RepID=UPI0028E6A66C|nr:SWIM zinc finger family protein [uncultured Clostridium sp.]
MKVNYEYASPSMCLNKGNETVLGLSPDISRDEKVSFLGKLKHPLIFRDAMLMLREIVISDMSQKKKERVEFFEWLDKEIERRILKHDEYLPEIRNSLNKDMNTLLNSIEDKNKEIFNLIDIKNNLKKEIDKQDIWRDYYKIEKDFWKFIKDRDLDLWFVLDPVITVHPDQVSFEAFSVDESTYGCLSIDMEEFELLQKPSLGTTNIDFSAKLAKEIERFRTYSEVNLSVNPEGFGVESGVMPEHMEKKIDLPETWIKGFNQVSSAASLDGVDVELSPIDMYDICSFLRRHKAKESPRYMKWILEPGKPIKITFEPFGKTLTLNSIYNGEKKREEKIWGRRRWLVLEKIIPLVKSFKVRLLGFGMPQFIIGDMGAMKMTIGFSSWSSNDWVKGTAFNILGGFIGEGNYHKVYELLKEKRFVSIDKIYEDLTESSKSENKAGIGMVLRRGEGYYDAIKDSVRFRRLCNEEIPKELYETTPMELKVQEHIDEGMDNFRVTVTEDNEFIFTHSLKTPNPKYKKWKYYRTDDFNREFDFTETLIKIDEEGQISKVKCDCRDFNKGPRNISAPCSHILALYLISTKFLKLKLEQNKEYKINDIMETVL